MIPICKGILIRQKKLENIEELDFFLMLFHSEWTYRIMSVAASMEHERQLNTSEGVPLTKEIVKLNNHIKQARTATSTQYSRCRRSTN